MTMESITVGVGNSAGRKPYLAPRLSVLGDVGSLTEAGSQPGPEADTGPFGCSNNMSNMAAMC